jgi:hypothetical protein
MHVRRIILEEDYETIAEWWTQRGGEPPPLNMLPDIGVIVEESGVPLSCAFLYTISNASIAVVEWEATNPHLTSVLKKVRALHMAFDFFEEWAKSQKTRFLLSWVLPGRGDGRLLGQRGWIKPQGEPHEMMAFVTTHKEVLCP